MSMDPLAGSAADPQSLNRYSYVMNNPVNFTDPSGALCQFSQIGCVGGGRNGDLMDSGCLIDGFTVNCAFAQAELNFGATGVMCSFQGMCPTPNSNLAKSTDVGWQFNIPGQGWLVPDALGHISFYTMSCKRDLSSCEMILHTFSPTTPEPSLLARLQYIPDASQFSWWGTFFSNYYDGPATRQSVVDAWNKGYYACIGKDLIPFKGLAAAAAPKGVEEAATRGAESGGGVLAGIYYHFTDGRFTAWGRSSKVLVPKAASKIAAVAKGVSVAGWLLTDVELAHALYKCNPVLYGGKE